MAVSTENAPTPIQTIEHAEKDRPARELVVAMVFGPLAGLLVRALLPLRISPPAVVLANAAAGLAAAVALGRGGLVLAALLLQLKSVLDNADGLLARASGRMTLLGRYLDTEADLLVNGALFVALGYATGEPWLALAAFVAATVLLSVDFNLAELHRDAYGRPLAGPTRSGGVVERALERFYRAVFSPQDRLLRAASERRLERILAGEVDPDRRRRVTLSYHDRLTFSFVANTGLSTQLAVLGACLVAGVPGAYLWLILASVLPLPLLQLRRERLARRELEMLRGAA
jgi:phosphatidylglycerophosphate synthase